VLRRRANRQHYEGGKRKEAMQMGTVHHVPSANSASLFLFCLDAAAAAPRHPMANTYAFASAAILAVITVDRESGNARAATFVPSP
jgi:hypothetical protein